MSEELPNPATAEEPLPCPICKVPVDPATRGRPKSTYPFCSERCKLIDLGRWLGGKYQIPVEDDDLDESPPPER
jgi:endogenous inhibitor of DNA gyrase (YacG/DUF329 family)